MDNPFGTGDPAASDQISSPPANPEQTSDSPKELTEAEKEALATLERDSKPPEVTLVEPPKPTEIPEAVLVMQKILAEYNYIESDIPLTHPEYWAAKRRLN